MRLIPCVLGLLACAVTGAAHAAPGSEGDLVRRALSDPTAWSIVESLTTEVGARPVGSPAMARARDWGIRTLTQLGFQNVHVETFTTPAWQRGAEAAEVVQPFPQKLQIIGLGNSTSTPPGGLSAPIALFRTYADLLAEKPGALAGKIAVVTQAMSRTQDGSSYGAINPQRTEGPAEAARRGAVAYLVRSISTADTRLPHAGFAKPGGIPAAALSTPDAELLEHMVERGGPVVVRLAMTSSVTPAATSWNVVGELPGRGKANEAILVGGHLDSWDPGTGAIDDGAGVAIMTAAAKLAASGEAAPRRTIRVVMWGSEEQTGSGGAYAAAHSREAANIVVAGESDLGAGRVWSVRLPKGALERPEMADFARDLRRLKVIAETTAPEFGGSDIEDLSPFGVPFVEFRQDASRYFDLHHSANDTLDKIDPRELAQNVAVWASFIHAAAASAIDFRKAAAAAAAK